MAPKLKPVRRPGRPQHDYRTCRDGECDRFACEVFREGRQDGYDDGVEDGKLMCTRPHAQGAT